MDNQKIKFVFINNFNYITAKKGEQNAKNEFRQDTCKSF